MMRKDASTVAESRQCPSHQRGPDASTMPNKKFRLDRKVIPTDIPQVRGCT